MVKLFKAKINKYHLYPVIHILVSTFLSWIVMSFIFPDLLINHKISFIRFADTEFNYYGVFTFLSNFYHGGIQLWNNYDQMPLAYYYLCGGLTSFTNLVVSIIYIAVSPFFSSPSSLFHTIYSTFYTVPSTFIRCSGYYLLLSRFTKNKFVLLTSTVLGSTLLVPQFYLGLNSTSLHSFVPLTIHFILKFFEKFRLNDLLISVLIICICIAADSLVAVGYFYQGIHIILIPIIVWSVITHRHSLKLSRILNKLRPNRLNIIKIFMTVFTGVLITTPWILMLVHDYKDYDLPYGTSRFANLNILDFSKYFKRETQYIPPNEFLIRLVDFSTNEWYRTWVFMGFTSVFLVISGVILSKDNRKYIFSSAIFLFWILANPRTPYGWIGLFHWMNAITNPLSVAVRSMQHTSAFLICFAFLPVITMGIQSLFDTIDKTKTKVDFIRLAAVVLFSFIYILLVFTTVSTDVKNYLQTGFFIALIIIGAIYINKLPKKFTMSVLILGLSVMLFSDGNKMSGYLFYAYKNFTIMPHAVKDNGPYFLDYQNPKILPFRQYYNSSYVAKLPGYIQVDPNNMQGLFYRYTDLNKYLTAPPWYFAEYTPRHISYKRLATDQSLQKYIQKNNQLIYQADMAISEGDNVMEEILSKSYEIKIIVVDKDPNISNIYFPKLSEIKGVYANDPPAQKIKKTKFAISAGKRTSINDLVFLQFVLPQDFPQYITTTVYTNDAKLMNVKIGDKILQPVQGNLISAFTYDVQNISTGKLTIALPVDFTLSNSDIEFAYPEKTDTGIINIYRNEPDNLGLNYNASHDGWLVFHYPYDNKWIVKMDGKTKELFRVNYSFMGVPVEKGLHTILLSYSPYSILRLFIFVSICIVLLGPFVIIWFGIRYLNL